MKKTLSLILSAFALTAFAQGTTAVPNQTATAQAAAPAANMPTSATNAQAAQAAQAPATPIQTAPAAPVAAPATSEQSANSAPATTTPAASPASDVQPATALTSTPSSNAQPATVAPLTLADAQKAYVNGKWKEAAAAYETVCPQQPAASQTECFLWNVLALSQTGVTADFVKAGKRLDTLIQKTEPQNSLYTDLVMTRAQFMLYLGKNTRAAETLILAIDNAQPRHKVVLQKVCAAVQAKVKNDTLNQRCAQLNEPATAAPSPQPTSSAIVQNAAAAPAPQPTSSAAAQPAAAAQPTAAPAPAPKAAPTATASPTQTSAPTAAPVTNEVWVLQLGAFGVKSNADILVDNLKKRGISCKIEERVGETKTLYIVQTTPFETKEKAIDFGATKLAPINVEFRAILKK